MAFIRFSIKKYTIRAFTGIFAAVLFVQFFTSKMYGVALEIGAVTEGLQFPAVKQPSSASIQARAASMFFDICSTDLGPVYLGFNIAGIPKQSATFKVTQQGDTELPNEMQLLTWGASIGLRVGGVININENHRITPYISATSGIDLVLNKAVNKGAAEMLIKRRIGAIYAVKFTDNLTTMLDVSVASVVMEGIAATAPEDTLQRIQGQNRIVAAAKVQYHFHKNFYLGGGVAYYSPVLAEYEELFKDCNVIANVSVGTVF